MGEPRPASAREVVSKGETRRFVVQALDAPRRGVELAFPEFAHVSGAPTEETVEASILEGSARTKKRRRQRQAAKERAKGKKKAPAEKKAKSRKQPAKKAKKAKGAGARTAKKRSRRA